MRWALVAALAAATVMAGCGSSRLSSSQLRTRATAICTRSALQTNRIPTPSTPAAGETFLKRGIEVLTPELSELRRLNAPDDLASVYRSSITAFTQKLTALREAVKQLDSGVSPENAMTSLQQRLAPLESAEDGAWQALEIPACLNR